MDINFKIQISIASLTSSVELFQDILFLVIFFTTILLITLIAIDIFKTISTIKKFKTNFKEQFDELIKFITNSENIDNKEK
ncbi:MAG: hypothetical protein FI687_03575 [SAR202 cluster bacterium]|nr:hypothetical protein [SAR202 cluster bacterium]|tara:strand:+ start:9131 stop:9373 length:243 start_codon:yes stop_codon:yes gene_type:complete